MESTVVLAVGEGHHLRPGIDRIVYAGMPSDEVFSVVQRKWEFMFQGYAWNLYFPKGQKDIHVAGVRLIVESVSPEQIVLRV